MNVAIWARDLEQLRDFYETYFEAKAGPRYTNPAKGFHSYFLDFGSGARLELMQRGDIVDGIASAQEQFGYAHLAFSVGYRISDHALLRLEAHRAKSFQADTPRPPNQPFFDVDYGIVSVAVAF